MAVAAEGPPLHRRRLGKRLTPYLLLAPALLWLVVFFVVPIVQMFFISLQEGNVDEGFVLTWNWAAYPEVLSTYDTQLIRSVVYELIVTLACLGIGYPLAYAIAFRGGRWKTALLFMVVLPFFVSYLIRTISWKFILADDGFVLGTLKDLGVLGEAYRVLATPTAVIFGLVYNFLPFMVLPLYVSLEKIDRSLIEAAEDLYADRRTAFRKVTLPLSL